MNCEGSGESAILHSLQACVHREALSKKGLVASHEARWALIRRHLGKPDEIVLDQAEQVVAGDLHTNKEQNKSNDNLTNTCKYANVTKPSQPTNTRFEDVGVIDSEHPAIHKRNLYLGFEMHSALWALGL